jgi:MFS family permease
MTAESRPATLTRAPASVWIAVIFLILVGILNFIDRYLPSVLAEPMKHDLTLSDTMLGFVNGIGFMLIYAITAIPIARLSDKGKYSLVITCSLAAWSVLTMVSGLARSGWQLAIARMGVAIGEAGSLPAGHVFVSRNFPAHRRAFVLSIFTLSVPIGMGLGFVIGGAVGQSIGWRNTFFLMGGLGIVLAPISHIILQRAQRESEALAPPPPPSGAPILPVLTQPAAIALMVGSALASFAGLITSAFVPAFLIRTHHMTVAQAGVQFGLLSGASGIVSLLLLGYIADLLARRHARGLALTLGAMYVFVVPFAIIGVVAPDRAVALTCLTVNYAICLAFLGPAVAALHRLVPVEMRARASAIMILGNAVFGGLGPLAAGVISDRLQPVYGPDALGHAMLIAPLVFALGAVAFFVSAFLFPADDPAPQQ